MFSFVWIFIVRGGGLGKVRDCLFIRVVYEENIGLDSNVFKVEVGLLWCYVFRFLIEVRWKGI